LTFVVTLLFSLVNFSLYFVFGAVMMDW